MRNSQPYTGTQYTRENGFRLVGAIMRLLGKRLTSNVIETEAADYYQQKAEQKKGKIIGKVAGREAYQGESGRRRFEEGKGMEVVVEVRERKEGDK